MFRKPIFLLSASAVGMFAYSKKSNCQSNKNAQNPFHNSQKELETSNNIRNYIANNGKSAYFISTEAPVDTFRGSIKEYIEKNNLEKLSELKKIQKLEITGNKITDGVYENSTVDIEDLQELMFLVSLNQIKTLDLSGCTLNPAAGFIIGYALERNTTLETLKVTSSQLERDGMSSLMRGLTKNQSLKNLHARSYNVERYYWSEGAVLNLLNLITKNTTLEIIDLPNNQIANQSCVNLLTETYKTTKDRKLAKITGLEFRLSEISDLCNNPDDSEASVNFKI